MNATSSRSHTLFMLYITGVHEAAGKKLEGCLNLVRGMVVCCVCTFSWVHCLQ